MTNPWVWVWLGILTAWLLVLTRLLYSPRSRGVEELIANALSEWLSKPKGD